MDPLLPPFREAVSLARKDVDSLRNLQQVLARREEARSRAWQHIPPGQDPRPRAQAARQSAISRLSELVETLERQCQANGIIVHYAATGQEAVTRVLALAQSIHPRAIAYAYGDVLEEVGVYNALLQANLPVVDIDFGGYVLRLLDDLPAHPVVPLAHLSSRDVARAWQEATGREVYPTPGALVEAIRARVRPTLARATLGIVAATFAVAETGTLVLADEEGQGSLIATLSPVLVVFLPIERVVASFEDLGPLLETQARARVGSAAYRNVSLVRTPAQGLRAREVHLFLVDNGRSHWGEVGGTDALACIGCGACVDVCPLYRSVGGQACNSPYMGPIGAIFSPLLWPKTHRDIARAESLCTQCAAVCPVGIDLPAVIARVRDSLLARSAPAPWSRFPRLPWSRPREDFLPPHGEEATYSPPVPPSTRSNTPFTPSPPAENSDKAQVDALIATLARRGVEVYRAETNVAARLHIASKAREWGRATVIGWDEQVIGLPGLADALAAVNTRFLTRSATHSNEPIAHEWFGADTAIVAASAALIETGTLILEGDARKPLAAGVLPRRAIVVLRASDIYPTWDTWVSGQSVSNALLLTGPSRTFAIAGKEVDVGLGVEDVHVILIEDGEERG